MKVKNKASQLVKQRKYVLVKVIMLSKPTFIVLSQVHKLIVIKVVKVKLKRLSDDKIVKACAYRRKCHVLKEQKIHQELKVGV